jgi:hypothetical protein
MISKGRVGSGGADIRVPVRVVANCCLLLVFRVVSSAVSESCDIFVEQSE